MTSTVAAVAAEQHDAESHSLGRADLIRIACVGFSVLLYWLHVPFSNYLAVAATLLGGYPIYEEALSNLREKRMTMELSMSIALFAALAISEAATALLITFFVLIAEALEKLTMSRGRNAIEHLLSLLPQDAFVRIGAQVEGKKVSLLQINDIVVIKPGARVPVDGEVLSGHSYIDQSTITGESIPAEKVEGDFVYAGTINQSGTLDVRTTHIGQDTAFGKIIHAVESAELYKAPIQKTADRLAGYLVYFAMGCALITFLVTHNMKDTISVVIVAGACGIAAGTPLAILGGVGRAARAGSIIKGGLFLELLGHIDTVVFDKTGTLTYGTPTVVDLICLDGASEFDVLTIAACAESSSEHPLGKAITQFAQQRVLEIKQPANFQYAPGKGIVCTVDGEAVVIGNRSLCQDKGYDLDSIPDSRTDASEVLIGKSQKLIGVIYVADVLRLEAAQAIADLKAMGIKSILLSGDTKAIAESVAEKLSIQEVAAGVLPEEKQDYIKKLAASGLRIAMVGDGINDAPALMEASVGVAIGSGTDVARESADVVLIGSDLSRFVETVRIARRCRRIIMTNFIGTLLVDGVGVLLAAFGYLSPLLAAFIHVSSELVFIMNSARLLPGKVAKTS
ncbi:MAG: cation-translocating P-type ATPase [Candidatus Obscuribacterales bacterium]|nr:cation-translocating P-type ATPase [Candidatus Obscuribacterales bacterium]